MSVVHSKRKRQIMDALNVYIPASIQTQMSMLSYSAHSCFRYGQIQQENP